MLASGQSESGCPSKKRFIGLERPDAYLPDDGKQETRTDKKPGAAVRR